MSYPSTPTSTAPVPQSEDLSNPITPAVSLSQGESVSSTARDECCQASASTEIHFPKQ
jgi:hypothetical protein